MPDRVATNIVVFGRGLRIDDAGVRLSSEGEARVRALLRYVEQNLAAFTSSRGLIVFSGGWAGAAEGLGPPPGESREAALMLALAHALGAGGADLSRYAETDAEIESDSTLENVLRVREAGYFHGISFTAENPLGLVAHAGHLPRIRYLVRKVFGLPDSAILPIVTPGTDNRSGGLPEWAITALTRLTLAGAGSSASLRRRHHAMVAALNLGRGAPDARSPRR